MSLSNLYTVDAFWTEAVRDLGNVHNVLKFEKFNLVNRACQLAQGLMADVVSESYITDTVVMNSTTGKYGTTGTFVAATGVLTATMDTGFSASDLGNMVILRSGTSVYVGTIHSRTSATVVTLTGDNLPTSDQASFNTITMATTTPSGTILDFSSVSMLRYGSQLNLQILSTSTDQVVCYPREGFNRWDNTLATNRNTIIYTIVGTSVRLDKGSSVSSYGTITFRYPRIPYTVSLTTEYVDLLDGSMVQVGIMLLRGMIQKRLSLPIDVDKNAIAEQIVAVYRSLNGEVKKEEVESKIEGLL